MPQPRCEGTPILWRRIEHRISSQGVLKNPLWLGLPGKTPELPTDGGNPTNACSVHRPQPGIGEGVVERAAFLIGTGSTIWQARSGAKFPPCEAGFGMAQGVCGCS